MLKISIITVTYNSAKTIEDTICSVLGQKGNFVLEYIIIDGNSRDKTLSIINKYKNKISKIVSEPDQGIYDAMNKGFNLASGNIVGILNSDDLYAGTDSLAMVAKLFAEKNTDSLYGDLVYVDPLHTDKIIRYWSAGVFKPSSFQMGWMPPHPTFFVKKQIYAKLGLFDLRLPLAADYELMLRLLLKEKISTTYLPKVLIKMRLGGASNRDLSNLIQNYRENALAWQVNGLKMPWYTLLLKRLQKLPQYCYTYANNKGG